MSFELLSSLIEKKDNRTVMGLDPVLSYVPEFMLNDARDNYGDTLEAAGAAITRFCMGLIDCAADYVAAVKPQSAFFEQYGIQGHIALERVIAYAKKAGLYVILDAKRGDIGTTAEAYANAGIGMTKIFENEVRACEADCITVNPYLGIDGVKPFIDTAVKYDKALFSLVKTSNPSGKEFQDIISDGEPVYIHVADKVAAWGEPYIGSDGYTPVGAVVGATYPEQLALLRKRLPHTFLLIPGYGAQGGAADDVAVGFDKNGGGAIVNSSRALMCAYKKAGDTSGENYKKHTVDAVIEMRDAINSAIKARS